MRTNVAMTQRLFNVASAVRESMKRSMTSRCAYFFLSDAR